MSDISTECSAYYLYNVLKGVLVKLQALLRSTQEISFADLLSTDRTLKGPMTESWLPVSLNGTHKSLEPSENKLAGQMYGYEVPVIDITDFIGKYCDIGDFVGILHKTIPWTKKARIQLFFDEDILSPENNRYILGIAHPCKGGAPDINMKYKDDLSILNVRRLGMGLNPASLLHHIASLTDE